MADRPVDLNGQFDAVWSGLTFTFLLFAPVLGPLVVLLVSGMLVLYAVVRVKRLPRVLVTIAPILLLPGIALLSTAWSVAPAYSAYYGVQYLITITIGALLGAGTDRRQMLFGIFAACAIHAGASVTLGGYVDWGGGGASGATQAFVGVMGSKNAAADTAAIGALVALVVGAVALRERRPLILVIAVAIVAMDGWIVVRAESTGAVISFLLGAVPLAVLVIARPLSPATRLALLIMAVVVALAAAATQEFWLKPLMSGILQAGHKDATLSGRSFIWARAQALIDQRPFLGLGYSGFWIRGNLEAEAIWRYMGIGDRAGYNFHSSWREITVHLGYVGLALYGLVGGTLAIATIIRAVRRPDDTGILFAAYTFYILARVTVESQGFSAFVHSTVMIAATLASALSFRATRSDTIASGRRAPSAQAIWR